MTEISDPDKPFFLHYSNTNAKLFADFATALEPFREIVDAAPKPNAFTKIAELVPNKGCSISYAADLCVMLTDQLRKLPEVDTAIGKVTGANWNSLVCNVPPS